MKKKRMTRRRKIELSLLRELRKIDKEIVYIEKEIEESLEVDSGKKESNCEKYIVYSKVDCLVTFNLYYQQRRDDILKQLIELKKNKRCRNLRVKNILER